MSIFFYAMSQSVIGSIFIFFASISWSIFPIASFFVLESIPLFLTMALCWSASSIFLLILLMRKNIWKEWKNSPVKKEILFATFLIGIWFHAFLFLATQYTSAGNIMILGSSELIFSLLFFHFYKKEKESLSKFIGAGIMMVGVSIILWEQIQVFSFNWGDIFVLIAMAASPVGNMFQKSAMKEHSPMFILFFRTLLIIPFFILLSFSFGEFISINNQSITDVYWWILFIGIIVFTISKLFWLEGIKRISIPHANAIALSNPFFTLLFAYLILAESPSFYQYFALIPFVIGGYFLVKK